MIKLKNLSMTIDPATVTNVDLVEIFIQLSIELSKRDAWTNDLSSPELYRRFFDCLGLNAFRELAIALRQYEHTRGIKAPNVQRPPIASELDDVEKALTESGRRIYAIKSARERLGCTLTEAKCMVDAWDEDWRDRKVETLGRGALNALLDAQR